MRRSLSATPVSLVGVVLGGLMVVLGAVHLAIGDGPRWAWLILIGVALVAVALLYARRPLTNRADRVPTDRPRD